MEQKRKKELKTEAKQLSAVVHIGKQGLSPAVITQIKNYLQAHHLGKIKFSKDLLDELQLDKKAFAHHLAQKVDAQLIDQIGFVIVLWKR